MQGLKRKDEGSLFGTLKRFGLLSLLTIAMALVLLLIVTFIVKELPKAEDYFRKIVIGIITFSSFFISFLSSKKRKSKNFMNSLIFGLINSFIIFVISLVINQPMLPISKIFIILFIIVAASILGGVAPLFSKGDNRKRKMKKNFRKSLKK